MKKFITGMGAGFIISALIITAFQIGQKPQSVQSVQSEQPESSLTDEQIMQRARELGMISYSQLPQNSVDKLDKEETENREETEETRETAQTDSTEEKPQSETAEVVIKSGMRAGDICELLVQKGIISDYDSFYRYIKEKNATQRLRSGKYILDKNSSNEDVYNALIGG